MKSPGQELYERWVEAMLLEGVGVDAWEELEEKERNAWDVLGQRCSREGWDPTT